MPNEHRREFVLTEDVIQEFVANGNESFGRLLTFLVDTGLRISEACELKWEDVNLPEPDQPERGWIHVKRGKTANARRFVPLTDRAADVLRIRYKFTHPSRFNLETGERLENSTRGERAFTAHGGRRKMSRHWPSQQFCQIRDKLKLPKDATLHSARHPFLANLGAAGVSAFEIMRLAGRASITISERYVLPTPARLEAAIGRMEAALTD